MRKWLRRAPYWGEGHQRLAQLHLATNRAADAYLELIAAERSPVASTRTEHLSLLFGRVLLALGQIEDAKARLVPLQKSRGVAPQVIEELAACHIAQNEYGSAYALLISIPEAQRTEAVQSMIKYTSRMQGATSTTHNGSHP